MRHLSRCSCVVQMSVLSEIRFCRRQRFRRRQERSRRPEGEVQQVPEELLRHLEQQGLILGLGCAIVGQNCKIKLGLVEELCNIFIQD